MIFIYSIVKITGTNFGCWMNSAIPVVFVSPSWLGPQFTDPILIQNFVRGIFHVWENGDEDQNNNYCSAILKKTWNSWSTGFWWLQWRWFNCKNTDLYIYIYWLIDLSTNYGRFQWTTILLFWVWFRWNRSLKDLADPIKKRHPGNLNIMG